MALIIHHPIENNHTLSLQLKPYLKHLFYQLHLAKWLDGFLYRTQAIQNRKQNDLYREQHPDCILPHDYVLYETYQLNYQKFIEDGTLAAAEITSWTRSYNHTPQPRILDWGCGAARITRHLPAFQPMALIYGCDVNEDMIEWNKVHYHNISFTTIHHFAPTPYADSFFDMVYGFSVFTHIDAVQQTEWIKELQRIINHNGVLMITTQGNYYSHQLLPGEKKVLTQQGVFTKSYPKQGHRMMSTYHKAEHFRIMILPYFEVLEYYDGNLNLTKAGGQDVWILRKRS